MPDITRIRVRTAEINVAFSEAYDSAPVLPRPIQSHSKFPVKYITGKVLPHRPLKFTARARAYFTHLGSCPPHNPPQGMLLESMSVAPLDDEERQELVDRGLDKVSLNLVLAGMLRLTNTFSALERLGPYLRMIDAIPSGLEHMSSIPR